MNKEYLKKEWKIIEMSTNNSIGYYITTIDFSLIKKDLGEVVVDFALLDKEQAEYFVYLHNKFIELPDQDFKD